MDIFRPSSLAFLIAPRSQNQDQARREVILNVLTLGYAVLAGLNVAIITYQFMVRPTTYDGANVPIMYGLMGCFVFLYVLSRLGKSRLAAVLFTVFTTLPIYYTSYYWGIDVPQTFILYSFSIIMAGVLLNAGSSLVVALCHAAVLVPLAYLQSRHFLTYTDTWIYQGIQLADGVISAVMLGVIALVSWLWNRVTDQALARAQASELALTAERDQLEEKVAARTQELKAAQQQQILQLYQFAEVGRLAAGLFHDLVNPLTAVSINLEQLQFNTSSGANSHRSTPTELNQALVRARHSLKNMEDFIMATRRQIQKQEIITTFIVAVEVSNAIQMVHHKAQQKKVSLMLDMPQRVTLYGNPIKFTKVIVNMVSNAIDAYQTPNQKSPSDRQVKISVKKTHNQLQIMVHDWGRGIPIKDQPFIFQPLFTTKTISEGTGLGLAICQDIIENDFKGTISFTSQTEKGTCFSVKLPITKKSLPSSTQPK